MLVDVRKNYGQPDSNIERQLMPRPMTVANGPTDWNEALDIISFGSPEQVNITAGILFYFNMDFLHQLSKLKLSNFADKYRFAYLLRFLSLFSFWFLKMVLNPVFQNIFVVQSVDGMKVVCHELAQATSDPEGSVMDELVKDADRLVSCLANKAR